MSATRYAVKDDELIEVPSGGVLAPTDGYSEMVMACDYDNARAETIEIAVKAARAVTACGCDFIQGFAWDGTHLPSCAKDTLEKVIREAVK